MRARPRQRARRRVATRGRADLARARRELGQVRRDAVRATTNLYPAGENVVEAGGAGMAAATDAGRSAIGLGSRMLALPRVVREGARRGRRAIERRGTRAVVSMLDTGTKVLRAAAKYVDDLAPRRRGVRRRRSVRRRRRR